MSDALDLSLVERARSALGRALRLTRAYGIELDQANQTTARSSVLEQGASPIPELSRQAGGGASCALFLPEGSTAPISLADRQLDACTRPVSPSAAYVPDSCQHDCQEAQPGNDRWWEEAEWSSASSTDCVIMPVASTADSAQPSADQLTPAGVQEDEMQSLQDASSRSPELSGAHSESEHGCSPAGQELHIEDSGCHAAELDSLDSTELSQPVSEIARRLNAVQQQQADTVHQLLQLRQVPRTCTLSPDQRCNAIREWRACASAQGSCAHAVQD